MNKQKESLAIKAYIRYVFQRVKYLKTEAVSCDEDNMYQFYLQLSKEICIWLNKHKIWAMFILKRIDFEKVKIYLDLMKEELSDFLLVREKLLLNILPKGKKNY